MKTTRLHSLLILLLASLLAGMVACDSVKENPAPRRPAGSLPGAGTQLELRIGDGKVGSFSLYDSLRLGTGYTLTAIPTTARGTLSFSASNNLYTWTSTRDSSGTDTLRFRVCNTANACVDVTVLVRVTITPPCVSVFRDDTLTISLLFPSDTILDLVANDNLCAGTSVRYILIQPSTLPPGLTLSGTQLRARPGNEVNSLPNMLAWRVVNSLTQVTLDTVVTYIVKPDCASWYHPVDDVVILPNSQLNHTISLPQRLAVNDRICSGTSPNYASVQLITRLDSVTQGVISYDLNNSFFYRRDSTTVRDTVDFSYRICWQGNNGCRLVNARIIMQ